MNKKNQDKIASEIIKELGLEKLPPERQNDILAKIGELILKKIFVMTIDRLSDTDKVAFEKMLEKQSTADEIEEFLKEKIASYEDLVEGIIVEIKKEIRNVG